MTDRAFYAVLLKHYLGHVLQEEFFELFHTRAEAETWRDSQGNPLLKVFRVEPVTEQAHRYRVGRKLGRTIYRDDQLIGVMDSANDAALIVRLLNSGAS